MPREFVHWQVIESTTERLADSPIKRLMQQHRQALLLGAMGPDAPYYYRLGTVPAVEKVAERIHGFSGNDTRESLNDIHAVQSRSGLPSPETTALLLGFISHFVTDSIFHPMVFYYSGDYYHPDPSARLIARRKHRLLEVFLDQAMLEQGLWKKERSLYQIFKQVDPRLGNSWLILDEALPTIPKSEPPLRFWRTAFLHMAILQRAFASRTLGQLFLWLRAQSPEKLGCLAALFSYQKIATPLSFKESITFSNPVTGHSKKATLIQLLDEAIARCAQIFADLELDDSRLTNLDRALLDFGGVSLNYGISGVSSIDAKYYSPLPSL